jgi:hypothetical protein
MGPRPEIYGSFTISERWGKGKREGKQKITKKKRKLHFEGFSSEVYNSALKAPFN